MAGLLYAKEIPINNKIGVYIPSVGEVLADENSYFDVVSTIIATPFDMMVQLDDAGIDFTKINSFELFCILASHLKGVDTSRVIHGFSFDNLSPAINPDNQDMVLVDVEREIVIDRVVHSLIDTAVRKILMIEKNNKKPANEAAKKYLIEKARRKQKRQKEKISDYTELESLIIGLVNTREFKYDYETVKNISILQFYASLKQVSHKIQYDNTMVGYYTGNIKFDDLSNSDRTWLKSWLRS